jgi:hypothetical protein
MSSNDEIPRTIITTEAEQRRNNRGIIERLSARFKQSVETRSKRPSFGVRHSGAERIKPADNLAELRKIPETTPIVRKALADFASDVVEPGYRIETDEDEIQEYLAEKWCPQCAILAGEKHNDLLPFLRLFTIERWRGGDALAEHVRANPDDPSSLFTGLHLINPEHVEFVTYQEKNILVDPDAAADIDVPQTRRGEDAAYVQYGSRALISTDRKEIPLSQNDVTRSALDPGAGDIRGTPITETIAEDVAAYKNILRDKEQAIKTKAWGLWDIGFGRDTLEYTDIDPETGEEVEVTDIIEWSEEDQQEYTDEHLDNIEPGAILTHDGEINLNRIEGDVPDLIDDLEHLISSIVAPLPTPLFVIGYESNINQFVTESQDERYQRLINEEREELERVFTDVMERVVEKNLVENDHADVSVSEVPDDLRFKLEPEESVSPVLSLDTETIQNIKTWAEAYNTIRGDIPSDMFADPASLRELILNLPEDAAPEEIEDELDEADPDLRQAAEDMGLMDEIDGADSDSSSDESNSGTGGADLMPPGINADD